MLVRMGTAAEMTERGITTRARLIAATVEVVREVGYAHATTRAIAQRAGVAEGTIYRHFPDKAALFFAAIFERNAALLEGLSGLADRAGQEHRRGQPDRDAAAPGLAAG